MANKHRYSHHANRALSHAEALARRFQHPYQDTAHLLVGVIFARGSIGSNIMAGLDLPPDVAEVYLKRLMPPSEAQTPTLAHDATFDQALELAADEATWLGHHYIGTEHFLLGITRTNVGNAIRLLRLVDIPPEQIRRRVRLALREGLTEFSLDVLRQNARLSELSRRVINAAEQTAVALDHPAIGLGHLLLALAQERRGVTATILAQSGLNAAQLRAELDAREDALLTSIEVAINQAIDQAGRLGSHYVGADHLLLAMTLISEGSGLLQQYGAAPDKVNRLLNKHLR